MFYGLGVTSWIMASMQCTTSVEHCYAYNWYLCELTYIGHFHRYLKAKVLCQPGENNTPAVTILAVWVYSYSSRRSLNPRAGCHLSSFPGSCLICVKSAIPLILEAQRQHISVLSLLPRHFWETLANHLMTSTMFKKEPTIRTLRILMTWGTEQAILRKTRGKQHDWAI